MLHGPPSSGGKDQEFVFPDMRSGFLLHHLLHFTADRHAFRHSEKRLAGRIDFYVAEVFVLDVNDVASPLDNGLEQIVFALHVVFRLFAPRNIGQKTGHPISGPAAGPASGSASVNPHDAAVEAAHAVLALEGLNLAVQTFTDGI